jgi:septum formation inhibitor-activating ATPase MinD
LVKKLTLFNHKGGVSKITTVFNLGWMLAEKGHTVPTLLILGFVLYAIYRVTMDVSAIRALLEESAARDERSVEP